ncbi:MAG: hypothetical protein ACE5G2_07170 [Candidatus Krumholzibacteriia bacterium]
MRWFLALVVLAGTWAPAVGPDAGPQSVADAGIQDTEALGGFVPHDLGCTMAGLQVGLLCASVSASFHQFCTRMIGAVILMACG